MCDRSFAAELVSANGLLTNVPTPTTVTSVDLIEGDGGELSTLQIYNGTNSGRLLFSCTSNTAASFVLNADPNVPVHAADGAWAEISGTNTTAVVRYL